jgi:hypothetical protein
MTARPWMASMTELLSILAFGALFLVGSHAADPTKGRPVTIGGATLLPGAAYADGPETRYDLRTARGGMQAAGRTPEALSRY